MLPAAFARLRQPGSQHAGQSVVAQVSRELDRYSPTWGYTGCHGCWAVCPLLGASNSRGTTGSVLGLVLFNTIFNDLEEATEGTSVGFAGDTILGGPADRQEGRLEEQASMDAVGHRWEQSCAAL